MKVFLITLLLLGVVFTAYGKNPTAGNQNVSGTGTPCTVPMWITSTKLGDAPILVDCVNGTVGIGGADPDPNISTVVGSHPGGALGIDTLHGPLATVGAVRVPSDLYMAGRNQADTANWDIMRWGYEGTDALSLGDTSGAWIELRHDAGRVLVSAPNRIDFGTNPVVPGLSLSPGAVTIHDRTSSNPTVAYACFTASGQIVQSMVPCLP